MNMKYTPKDGFPYYVNLVGDTDCKSLFESQETFTYLKTIDEEKANYRYAHEKWSIKEVVGHIADHERIKMYRAFLLSRRQSVQLWGYDQDSLVENSRFTELTLGALTEDLRAVRMASQHFVRSLSEEQMGIKGMARDLEITLKEFLMSIIGHEIHHFNILKERYC